MLGGWFGEEAEDAGKAVDEGALADGADFAVAEEARDRQRPKAFLHRADVVMRRAVHPFAASETGEEQRGARLTRL